MFILKVGEEIKKLVTNQFLKDATDSQIKKFINIISSDCITNNKKIFFLFVIQR